MALTLVARSTNSKLTKDPGKRQVAATYVAQGSCPSDCAFLKAGCYAESGHVGRITHRLNREPLRSPVDYARAEAALIRSLPVDVPLRLHVVGDTRTEAAARILSRAVREWGGIAWGYTHAWRKVPRAAWRGVSMLASVESAEQAVEARKRGYAPAQVVTAQRTLGASLPAGMREVPCPEQTGKAKDCESCRLCWRADVLHAVGSVITFVAHGATRKVAEVLQHG